MPTGEMTLYGINEPRPGARWKALFDAVWPAYRTWYLSEGRVARPKRSAAAEQLQRHMPELVGTWQSMVALAHNDELAATMLTLWDAPKFLPGCSQAALVHGSPALIRNYDYSPDLFERVVYSSAFAGQRVIGTSDCLWGLLDGMNESGLAVSLAFGGRPGSAPGFASPLVLRYLLEVTANVEEAKAVLSRLPVSMSYNFTMVDAKGQACTAFVAPRQPPEFSTSPVATNHRGTAPEYPEHARRFHSVERQQHLLAAVTAQPAVDELAAAFLKKPIFNDEYDQAFGTLYTAVYRPTAGTVEYRWPNDTWIRSFDSPEEVKTVAANSPTRRPDDSTAAPDPSPASSIEEPVDDAPTAVDTSSQVLADEARSAIAQLSHRADPAAFKELLSLYESLGIALGESARNLAEHGSWSHVGNAAGVSRQAAWYRWRE